MAELCPVAQWNPKKDGILNEEWVRFYTFFKTNDPVEYETYRKEILLSVRNVIQNLEENQSLESFHFSGQPFPRSFDLNPLFFFAVLDVRIWIKGKDVQIEEAKNLIREEFNRKDDIADFGFWHFRKDQPSYCTDSESRIYYDIICRVYELFCRFLFEKLDPQSSKTLDPNGFSNLKIVHHFLNSQGMSFLEEAYLGILYTYTRLRALELVPGRSFKAAKEKLDEALNDITSLPYLNQKEALTVEELERKYLFFPLQVGADDNGKVQVRGQWDAESDDL
ncbi:MAG: hypothetical protein HXS40_03330 [Theionarchaea archaeon]|nr:hypothetical protein [Theionarchaea archaeon]